ncbi:MAG: segregation/condensation protein A [Phycisphaerales bacterium]|nr:segregation/condensation protein A [Phycisphaerales bacterium]
MSIQDEYTVRLSNFEGPLDLLLHLIRRAEVDIHDIPIAEITEKYLEAISDLDRDVDLDIDFAGEFLVMAATLIELKSRTLTPASSEQPEDVEGEEDFEDPRHELVKQLLAYQRFRSAAGNLDAQRREFADRWSVRIRGDRVEEDGAAEERSLELDDVHPGDLLDAFERIMSAIDVGKLGEHEVEYDDTPIGLHQEDIVDRLGRSPNRRFTLQDALEGRRRGEMIGLFLAVLELARQHRIRVSQSGSGAIELELRDDAAED